MTEVLALNTDLFGSLHLIILALCVVYIAGALILLKKFNKSIEFVEKCLLVIGFISESIKVFSYIVMNEEEYHGYLPKTDLPFHLCSLQIIFILILNLSKNENLKRLLYSFMLPTCLIGGFFALIIATYSSRNVPIITVQYFLYHCSIMVFAVYLLISKKIDFTVKDYVNCLIMLIAMGFIAIYLNSWINDNSGNINFMYVVKPPMDGLPFLTVKYGWLVYITHYFLLAFLMISICYISPIVKWFKSKFTE